MGDLTLQFLLCLGASVDVEYDNIIVVEEMESNLSQRNLCSSHAPRDLGIIEKVRDFL